ncbi:MAG: hypothetical protein ABW173_04115 [Sphingomonas sp.]
MIGAALWMLAAASPAPGLLDRLVERLRASGTIPPAALRRMTGAPLRMAPGTAAYRVRTAEARDGEARLGIELRTPRPGGGATAGALTIVRVRTGCIPRGQVIARYAPLAVSAVPHGHALAEETSWSRRERHGLLSFGFAEARPDCLSTVTFDGTRRPVP